MAVLAPEQGGHVGFISGNAEGEKRFWSEMRAVEFVKLIANEQQTSRNKEAKLA